LNIIAKCKPQQGHRLTGSLAKGVRTAAEARGLSPDELVRQVVENELDAGPDAPDWSEDLRRLAESGENVPLDEAFDRFRAKIAAERAKTK
jgi:hypothetical protein